MRDRITSTADGWVNGLSIVRTLRFNILFTFLELLLSLYIAVRCTVRVNVWVFLIIFGIFCMIIALESICKCNLKRDIVLYFKIKLNLNQLKFRKEFLIRVLASIDTT